MEDSEVLHIFYLMSLRDLSVYSVLKLAEVIMIQDTLEIWNLAVLMKLSASAAMSKKLAQSMVFLILANRTISCTFFH